MLKFDKLFNEVMPSNDITIYTLYNTLKVARSQIYRLKEGKVQVATVNMILQLLYERTGKVYQPSDICEVIPEQSENKEEE